MWIFSSAPTWEIAWCWKPFSGMLSFSLLLSIMILIIGFTCPASIRFKFMTTKCNDYNKVQQNMRDVVIWIHTIFHFLADFCLDVKAERRNVWRPFIILVMVPVGCSPTLMGLFWICHCTLNRLYGEKKGVVRNFFFSSEQQIFQFFSFLLLLLLLLLLFSSKCVFRM